MGVRLSSRSIDLWVPRTAKEIAEEKRQRERALEVARWWAERHNLDPAAVLAALGLDAA